MKRKSIFFVLLALTFIVTSAHRREAKHQYTLGVKKVVIDAGHGGHDPGAVGKKYKESLVALNIALKLGAKIKAEFPDVEVLYTRSTDVFVELYRRAQIANENKADLFISIHCNASKSTTASGTETWVMGLHKSEANLEVAKQENATILLEDNYSSQYDGFDPNSPEANIIFSLYQNVFLDQSLTLAAQIQKQFERSLGRGNRGVKQAGFLVLYKTTMPGVLIESGFISNPDEETYLGSEQGQDQLATAIFRAFKAYKAGVEKTVYNDDDEPVIPVYVPPADTTQKTNDAVIEKDPVIVKDPPVVIKDTTVKKADEIFFRVQFSTSSVKKSTSSAEFSKLSDVRVYFHGGLYKYTSGNLATLDEANKYLNEVKAKGYKDAFVVAFLNEQRITPEAADQMLKNQKK
jgi:N-acetylmuramoyl-L-alanine amidase